MKAIEELLEIMASLRDPKSGCPWDKEQNFSTIAPYTLEEAYEVQDAIQRQDYNALKNELGDLLLQVVYHSQIAKEAGLFEFDDVVESISEKMVRRHPHVFADEVIESAADQSESWEAIKEQEKTQQNTTKGILDDVIPALPALKRAQKIQSKAARVGFDWPDIWPVIKKIEEELQELKYEIKVKDNHEAIADETGDLLFACVNLARHMQLDAEYALGLCNQKFIRRFKFIEKTLKQSGKSFDELELEQLDDLWEQAKSLEG